jgi:hypothetical protein
MDEHDEAALNEKLLRTFQEMCGPFTPEQMEEQRELGRRLMERFERAANEPVGRWVETADPSGE